MKKTLLFMMMLGIMLSATLTFSSCSNDNEESEGIVGTWRCDRHYIGGPDTYVFKSNGQYTWSCPGQPGREYDSGHYSFDSKRSTLTTVNENGTVWLFVIASLTSTSFTMIDEDGDTYYYRK